MRLETHSFLPAHNKAPCSCQPLGHPSTTPAMSTDGRTAVHWMDGQRPERLRTVPYVWQISMSAHVPHTMLQDSPYGVGCRVDVRTHARRLADARNPLGPGLEARGDGMSHRSPADRNSPEPRRDPEQQLPRCGACLAHAASPPPPPPRGGGLHPDRTGEVGVEEADRLFRRSGWQLRTYDQTGIGPRDAQVTSGDHALHAHVLWEHRYTGR